MTNSVNCFPVLARDLVQIGMVMLHSVEMFLQFTEIKDKLNDL